MTDDFMGLAFLNMGHYLALTQSGSVQSRIPLEIPEDVGLYAGYLTVELNMKEISEVERAQISKRTKDSSSSSTVKKAPDESQWNFIVDLVLVEAKILQVQTLDSPNGVDQDQEADFYVKFILGTQKFKSKVCRCSRNQHPKWGQRFSSRVSEDYCSLTVKLCNRFISSRVIGECSINLKLLSADRTHKKWFELENGVGKLFLTISLSAAANNINLPRGNPNIDDLKNFGASSPEEIINLLYSQPLPRGFVGRLLVTVYKAENLAAADLGGKSDPFCVLELVNQRVKTKTVYKTLEPEWNKTFLLYVKEKYFKFLN
uniref:C2 domain-containing protein n=1 Tax=Romanomermis culicivorax TaxID=13658 RepID=A0A915J5C4_ROMCU